MAMEDGHDDKGVMDMQGKNGERMTEASSPRTLWWKLYTELYAFE